MEAAVPSVTSAWPAALDQGHLCHWTSVEGMLHTMAFNEAERVKRVEGSVSHSIDTVQAFITLQSTS